MPSEDSKPMGKYAQLKSKIGLNQPGKEGYQGARSESMTVHPNVSARKAAVPSGHANAGTDHKLQHYTSSQG